MNFLKDLLAFKKLQEALEAQARLDEADKKGGKDTVITEKQPVIGPTAKPGVIFAEPKEMLSLELEMSRKARKIILE